MTFDHCGDPAATPSRCYRYGFRADRHLPIDRALQQMCGNVGVEREKASIDEHAGLAIEAAAVMGETRKIEIQ